MIRDYIDYFSTGAYEGVWQELEETHHAVTERDFNPKSITNNVVKQNPYHHENVMNHIMMVFLEAEEFGKEVQQLALLHDIAKPYMRYYIEEKQRARFTGHEYGSALFSVNFLKERYPDKVLSFLKVISMHIMAYTGNPYEYDLDEYEIDLLKKLNTADNRGRFSDDPKEMKFENWVPVEDQTEVTGDKLYEILIGIPGSGKSSYTNELPVKAKVFSTDARMEEIANAKFGIVDNYNEAFNAMSSSNLNWVGHTVDDSLRELRETNHVVLDATNLTKKKRGNIAKRARREGARVKYVMFWRDFQDCLACRSDGDKTIPNGVWKRMISSFTYPSSKEYDEIEHVVV